MELTEETLKSFSHHFWLAQVRQTQHMDGEWIKSRVDEFGQQWKTLSSWPHGLEFAFFKQTICLGLWFSLYGGKTLFGYGVLRRPLYENWSSKVIYKSMSICGIQENNQI